jgi:hypothetical protein
MKHERMPSAHPRRRALQRLALACTALAVPALWAAAPAGRIPVEVWKDPNCGCCQDWVAHMEHNGFAVTVHDTGNSAVRTRLGIPARLGPWAAPAWTAPSTAAARTPTKCCSSPKTS